MIRSTLFIALLWSLLLSPAAHSQMPGCPEIDRTTMALALNAPVLASVLSVETAKCDGLWLDSGCVGFRLTDKTLPVYGGIRTEVAVDFPYSEGESVRYSWEMMFPEEFAGDSPLNRWWLLAQWHDQPDRRIGEKWEGFPPRSPPVAIYFEERDGDPGIGVILNGRDKRSWTRIPRNEWLALSMTVHWSRHDDGGLVFEIAGHPEFHLSEAGANMHNAFQHYLKFGQYRHPQIKANSTVFFRNLSILKLDASVTGVTTTNSGKEIN